MAADELNESVDEDNLADFLNNSYNAEDLTVKERIKPSKQVQRSLVTISESSEILYPLVFQEISFMDQELVVPPISSPTEAVGGERLKVCVYNDIEDEEEYVEDEDDFLSNNANSGATVTPGSTSSSEINEVSDELSALKDRAKKLSEELKMLTNSAFHKETSPDIEPISQDKIRSILNENPLSTETNNNLFEATKKKLHPITVVHETPAPSKIEKVDDSSIIRINTDCYVMESEEEDEEEEEEEEEEQKVALKKEELCPRLNFDRRGPKNREEKPSFQDLSLKGEKQLKVCKGGARDWCMPFREKLYFESTYQGQEKEIDFLNPIFYAPTGDIYSYFQRRQLYPHPFKMPTQYQIKQVLSNRKKTT